MGAFQSSSKSSYFNLIKKDIKYSFDYIQASDFNKEYSIRMNKLVEENKKIIKRINIEGEIVDWKRYLLDSFINRMEGTWKNFLFEFIQNELKTDYAYLLENEVFMSQIILKNFPQFYIKDPKRKNEPILFLFEKDELKIYSYEQNLMAKAKKMKNKKKRNISKEKTDIELQNIDTIKIHNDSEENNRIESYQSFEISKNSKHLHFGEVKQDELCVEEQDLKDDKIFSKYNSYRIREHISVIRKQLEKLNKKKNPRDIHHIHPIYIIIKEFSKFYSAKIKEKYDSIKKDKNLRDIERIKEEVIKDIQTFIEIISVALKLFYAKTINYEFFVSEGDEFFNLISYFLFNQKDFYSNLFNLFELSNEQKLQNLNNKIKKLGNLETKEAGIKAQFCLDDDTKKLKESKELKNIVSNYVYNKKRGLAGFLEVADVMRKRLITLANAEKREINEYLEGEVIKIENKENENKNKNEIRGRSQTNVKIKNDKNDNKNKNINEEKMVERKITIISYQDFSENINNTNTTLLEKYQDDMDENPSLLDIPKFEELKNDSNKPYGEAIYYIKKIKEYNTPLDKLTIIALTSVLVTDCVDNFWKDVKKLPEKYLTIDADQLISIYLYIVYNMELNSIYTQLDFIKHFTGSKTQKSMVGYYYTTIEGSLNFIMSANTKEDLIKNIDN